MTSVLNQTEMALYNNLLKAFNCENLSELNQHFNLDGKQKYTIDKFKGYHNCLLINNLISFKKSTDEKLSDLKDRLEDVRKLKKELSKIKNLLK